MYYSGMGLCSGHGDSVVIRELSLYPQSLLAKLTVLLAHHEVKENPATASQWPVNKTSSPTEHLIAVPNTYSIAGRIGSTIQLLLNFDKENDEIPPKHVHATGRLRQDQAVLASS